MGVLTNARATLATALGPVLPGRVHAYKPSRSVAAAGVLVWIGDHTTSPSFAGVAAATTLSYPIVIVSDGAEHGAGAMLDRLVETVLDAVAATAGWASDGHVPTTVPIDADRELAGYEVTAVTTLYVATFCSTDPPATPVTIPAIPVEVP